MRCIVNYSWLTEIKLKTGCASIYAEPDFQFTDRDLSR